MVQLLRYIVEETGDVRETGSQMKHPPKRHLIGSSCTKNIYHFLNVLIIKFHNCCQTRPDINEFLYWCYSPWFIVRHRKVFDMLLDIAGGQTFRRNTGNNILQILANNWPIVFLTEIRKEFHTDFSGLGERGATLDKSTKKFQRPNLWYIMHLLSLYHIYSAYSL